MQGKLKIYPPFAVLRSEEKGEEEDVEIVKKKRKLSHNHIDDISNTD